MRGKKGVSGVITVVILILIVLVLAGIIWQIVIPLVRDNLDRAKACSQENLEKIELNHLYTCYTTVGEVKVSIETKDIKYDKIILSATQGEEKRTVNIPESLQGKNVGKTHTIVLTRKQPYLYFDFPNNNPPDSIKIIPVIDGTECQVVDSISDLKQC